MEDGVKEEPAQRTEPKFLGKAGWVKKAPGRMLASYKDRYIHVEKTEMVVYENEDLKNCIERLDLEHYDKCQESKNLLRKKHRLVLIRSPKSRNKVLDVKFQAQTAEEKEAWIKAFTDGINRAKNKVFDEVKVDESMNLEHVTRTRPKGNRTRRPPTRIHMKELAIVSSDGLLRLDLDLEDAVVNIGSQNTTADGAKTPKETNRSPMESLEEEPEAEADVSPQKKVIKPPMPPNKAAKPTPTPAKEGGVDDFNEPPAAPSKETKPSLVQEDRNEGKAEKSPDTRKRTSPPPIPPNKPISSSTSDLTEGPRSGPSSHPPTPPSQDKKPSRPPAEPNETPEENEVKKEDEDAGTPAEKDEARPDDTDTDPQMSVSVIPAGETPSPPLTPKMNRPELVQPLPQHAVCWDAPDTEGGDDEGDEEPLDGDVPMVKVSVNEPVADNLGPLLCPLSGEEKVKAEDKSVDSGQHSDADSELSLSDDALMSSTAALRGSTVGLDVLDDIQDCVRLKPEQGTAAAQVSQHSDTVTPLELSGKLRSASTGDLLSSGSPVSIPATRSSSRAPTDDVMNLKTEREEMEHEHRSRETESQEESSCQGRAVDPQPPPADLLHAGVKRSKHRRSW